MAKTEIEVEKWKDLKFEFESTNQLRIQISNRGRLRSFHKLSNGNIINGSFIKGYRIVRLKFFSPRSNEKQLYFNTQQKRILRLTQELSQLKKQKNTKRIVKEKSAFLDEFKKKVSAELKADVKSRSIHFHSLVHRLVATYFLKKPTVKQTVVGHLDYDKLNNNASNLKWMTHEESAAHQQKSPYVIKARRENVLGLTRGFFVKLKEKEVAQIKKLLKQGKLAGHIAKRYNVSETQIIRIRKGENWRSIKAAE